MTVIDQNLESQLVLKEIIDLRKKLNHILEKYNAANSLEIEAKIQAHSLPEHPSYEDYLAALDIENSIQDLKIHAKNLIEAI